MSTLRCLRCKTAELSELNSPDPQVRFFQCPSCARQFSLEPLKGLVFRWGHPISLALYPVLFDVNPQLRADDVARTLQIEQNPERLGGMVREIRLELADPTQQLRDMLDCAASESDLRGYLRRLADQLEAALPPGIAGDARPLTEFQL